MKHLYDILHASQASLSFVHNRTRLEYGTDLLLRSGVERQLSIVGEAMTRLRKIEPSILDQVTHFRRIIDFRNVLVHGYDVINDQTVWEILHQHLPVLIAEVEELLRRGDQELAASGDPG